MQNTIYLLSEINQINNQLLQLCENTVCCDEIAYKLLGDSTIQTDDERAQKHKGKKISFLGENCQVQPYNRKMRLEYYGFCTWMLSQGRGILIPGIPDLGIVLYNSTNYVFSAPDLAPMFEDNPEKVMHKIIEAGRHRIELIRLLDTYEHMKHYYYEAYSACGPFEVVADTAKPTAEVEVQTELHPIPYNIDKDYMWNVWDIRRKAIQLTNLRKCKTKSAQTMMSYQRYNVQTQANMDRKSAHAQTKRDGVVSTRDMPTTRSRSLDDELAECLGVTKL